MPGPGFRVQENPGLGSRRSSIVSFLWMGAVSRPIFDFLVFFYSKLFPWRSSWFACVIWGVTFQFST